MTLLVISQVNPYINLLHEWQREHVHERESGALQRQREALKDVAVPGVFVCVRALCCALRGCARERVTCVHRVCHGVHVLARWHDLAQRQGRRRRHMV